MIAADDCTVVGTVVKPHGLDGNLVVRTDCFPLEDFEGEPVFLILEGRPVPFFIVPGSVKPRGNSCILRFEGVSSHGYAERLVGAAVAVETKMLGEDSGDFDDIYRFAGFEVEDESSGRRGVVADVADYSGNVVFTVEIAGKEVLLPFGEHFIKDVDTDAKLMRVFIPEDLYDLN